MQTFPALYKDSVFCFRQTFQKDGIRGLYAGGLLSWLVALSRFGSPTRWSFVFLWRPNSPRLGVWGSGGLVLGIQLDSVFGIPILIFFRLGTTPALAANIAENSVLFAAYGVCQKAVAFAVGQRDVAQLNPFHNACAGSLAAVFSSFTLCPTELVKCRLQALREMRSIDPGAVSNVGKM